MHRARPFDGLASGYRANNLNVFDFRPMGACSSAAPGSMAFDTSRGASACTYYERTLRRVTFHNYLFNDFRQEHFADSVRR